MKIKVNNFNLEEVLLSGACFRCIKELDGSFTNILSDRIINIRQEDNYLYVLSNKYDNLENIILEYFDLNRDYDYINNKLILYDSSFEEIVSLCNNYRIINQDFFEMCISYIISQNNNVKRISNSINKLCELYGECIIFNNKKYYLFPKYEVLKKLKEDDFKSVGVGFRAKYIVDYLNKYDYLKDIGSLNTIDALNKLLTVKGIGLKVGSCILLFGYKRLDVFPIDTWVKQFIKERYNIKDDIKVIEEYTKNIFKEYSGLAIQYMYHYNRNKVKK